MMISTPPRVITSKDLSYLKDQMSWELIAMKKCNHFADEVTDPEVKSMLNRMGQMHQQHYQRLLKHCQVNNAAGMSQISGQMAAQQQGIFPQS
jgi:rubrerythrin